MSNYHWIKLYDEILDDPKMGRLSDGAYRLCINIFLLANRSEERDGRLPDFEDMAWVLRLSTEDFHRYWQELERAEIVCVVDSMPMVKKFSDRQTQPVPVAERVRAHRERKQQDQEESNASETPSTGDGNDDVTTRYQIREDIDIDKEEDKDSLDADASSPPDERNELDVYLDEILSSWKKLFPEKPQPRRGTYRDKIKTRIKSAHFRENWQESMATAARSPTCHSESWFNLEFFVRNDENYIKCLNDWMNWKDQRVRANGKAHSGRPKTAADSYAEVFGS